MTASIALDSLSDSPSFALLGPGFRATGRWTLLPHLVPCEAGEPTLWFASYETPGQEALRLGGEIRDVLVEFPKAPKVLPAPKLAEEGFGLRVAFIHNAIAAGDVYQVNLTLRAHLRAASGAQVLARLCRQGLPRFAAWVRLPNGTEFVSASPELLFETHGKSVRAEPMKGTAGPDQREWLAQSQKDAAELAMITDLLRNDLNALCVAGSVEVPQARRFIELPYAIQAVSDVTGRLAETVSLADVVSQLHPGGSVTGAPKGSARAIIEQLEPSPRGAYCGTLGLEFDGSSRFALLIRTAQRSGEREWVYGVGGGITWDSVAELELEEIRVKMGALG